MTLPKHQFESLYDQIADLWHQTSLCISPSDVHGMLCAYICMTESNDTIHWLCTELAPADEDNEEQIQLQQLLLDLHQHSLNQLTDMTFEFQLLLPDDEESLELRARELSLWCQGFNTGLGMQGIDLKKLFSEETHQAIAHFSEFANIDYQQLSISEEDEKAYMEVLEYVRMAVVMLFVEMASSKDKQRTVVQSDDTKVH